MFNALRMTSHPNPFLQGVKQNYPVNVLAMQRWYFWVKAMGDGMDAATMSASRPFFMYVQSDPDFYLNIILCILERLFFCSTRRTAKGLLVFSSQDRSN